MTALDAARLPPTDHPRLLAGWAETGAITRYSGHRRRYGPLPGLDGPRLIELVSRSGLRGRGGAGFPTARKLRAVADGRGRRIVVANGCEGDPASAKDGVLLELAPHLVLDGIQLAARAVGANEAILAVHTGSRLLRTLAAALRDRGTGEVPVELAEVPRRYVASEESALVNHLTSGDARPTVTPPRPARRGVRGRPTLVDNVETLAHIALIARHGDGWFREAGTRDSPGTTLVTVGGAVALPGVYEIDLGMPVAAVLALAGGPVEPLQAVQIGGLGGSWLPLPYADGMPFTHEDARAVEAGLGVAALVALPVRACGIAETARVLRYLADESAGQCGPCMFGLPAVADDMAVLADGADRSGVVVRRLQERLGVIPGRGACAHPDGAVRLAAGALRVFAADVARHARGDSCTWTGAPPWLPTA
ncbi:NADH-ubiquinone oxidoreductase-F iron-sulfur binding region domain-containing protein [Pseudonocardia sp. 73-21]|uniref:NADH-ubiquinone oxidoreductase-F iron-sulfur binding region domain-containing protein n=1 Tax=Pseudonocardia sp. 73-21 TaxID=1895809 RepID=UPI0009591095|nr:NADH-ubiquinone oxidoreductase-F iron-sulfur binding region domain-containing protein [Pseudonocardia sp. 73-21]OJY51872.1 MAG: NADH dehydrogenase [Pseudonocardia sp. 73-21]